MTHRVYHAKAEEFVEDMRDAGQRVDAIICSPPYEAARSYRGSCEIRRGEEWATWAASTFKACLEICDGVVAWVVEGQRPQTVDWSGAPALMMANLLRDGVKLWHPAIYGRYGLPGRFSCLRNNWEFIVVGSNGEVPEYADPTAVGQPPVITVAGGKTRPRGADGSRNIATREFKIPTKCNHGNLLWCGSVGGGVMGSKLAHENEAPFPEYVPWVFIQSYVPDGGIVCDIFSGSGTTAAAAIKAKRNLTFIGCDSDSSQVQLTRRRIEESNAAVE